MTGTGGLAGEPELRLGMAGADVPDTEAADVPTAGPAGAWLVIAFMGHTELTGYVTEVTLHGGVAAYHVDLPGKLWGGNPLDWQEYPASVLFSKRPVTEESVRSAWEAERERAEQWRRQREAWARRDEQRALPAGDEDGDLGDDGPGCGCAPGFTCQECRAAGVF